MILHKPLKLCNYHSGVIRLVVSKTHHFKVIYLGYKFQRYPVEKTRKHLYSSCTFTGEESDKGMAYLVIFLRSLYFLIPLLYKSKKLCLLKVKDGHMFHKIRSNEECNRKQIFSTFSFYPQEIHHVGFLGLLVIETKLWKGKLSRIPPQIEKIDILNHIFILNHKENHFAGHI